MDDDEYEREAAFITAEHQRLDQRMQTLVIETRTRDSELVGRIEKEFNTDVVRTYFPQAARVLRRMVLKTNLRYPLPANMSRRVTMLLKRPDVAACLLDFDGADGVWMDVFLSNAISYHEEQLLFAVINHPRVSRESVIKVNKRAACVCSEFCPIIRNAIKSHERWLWTLRRTWILACVL